MPLWTPGEIRQLRVERGWSASTLARLLGVHPNAVRHWEHGRAQPKPRNRRRLKAVRQAFPPLDGVVIEV